MLWRSVIRHVIILSPAYAGSIYVCPSDAQPDSVGNRVAYAVCYMESHQVSVAGDRQHSVMIDSVPCAFLAALAYLEVARYLGVVLRDDLRKLKRDGLAKGDHRRLFDIAYLRNACPDRIKMDILIHRVDRVSCLIEIPVRIRLSIPRDERGPFIRRFKREILNDVFPVWDRISFLCQILTVIAVIDRLEALDRDGLCLSVLAVFLDSEPAAVGFSVAFGAEVIAQEDISQLRALREHPVHVRTGTCVE